MADENSAAKFFSSFSSVARQYAGAYAGDASIQLLPTVQLLRKDLIRKLAPSGIVSALEVGGGPAAYADFLLEKARAVTCLDVAPGMLDSARARYPEAVSSGRLDLVLGTATSLPFDNGSFELVVAAGVLEYVEDDVTALREIRRCLAPGGTAIVTFPLHHPLTMRVAKARARFVRSFRATMGIAPSTDVPFPFHRNYRHSQIAQRVAVAGSRCAGARKAVRGVRGPHLASTEVGYRAWSLYAAPSPDSP
jgi:ubiquinone/menaquinone biosynthesis C-methylase UbiE